METEQSAWSKRSELMQRGRRPGVAKRSRTFADAAIECQQAEHERPDISNQYESLFRDTAERLFGNYDGDKHDQKKRRNLGETEQDGTPRFPIGVAL
jgi:hypothetical protein